MSILLQIANRTLSTTWRPGYLATRIYWGRCSLSALPVNSEIFSINAFALSVYWSI